MLEQFHFIRPLWLLFLPLLLILLWWLWQRARSGSELWHKVCDAHLLPHLLVNFGQAKRRMPLILLGIGWLVTILALAGPTWSKSPESVYRPQHARVLILDLSKTMDAKDIQPSRLVRAKYKMLDILKRSEEAQTALIVFAGTAFSVTPLTDDATTISYLVNALSTDLMPVPGKRTWLALEKAGELLIQGKAKRGEIILISDEVGYQTKSLAQARKLREQGYSLSVLAVGTTQVGLQALAREGGGVYVELSNDERDLDILLKSKRLSRSGLLANSTHEDWQEQGYWLLLLLLPLVALSFRRGFVT